MVVIRLGKEGFSCPPVRVHSSDDCYEVPTTLISRLWASDLYGDPLGGLYY